MGLDLQTWLKEGIIDILIAGGYAPFSQPVEELAKAAHSYGVPLYPCINPGGVLSDIAEGRFLEYVRALMSKWYAAGADGVYFFNLGSFFVPLFGDEKAWRSSCREWYRCLYEVGDPQAIQKKNKLYSAAKPVLSLYAFVSSEADLPLELEEDIVRQVPLEIGDDVEAIMHEGTLVTSELELDIKGPIQDVQLLVRLNGIPLSSSERVSSHSGESGTTMLKYSVNVPPLRKGRNMVEISLARGGTSSTKSVTVSGLRLQIAFPEADGE
jgi:hypothetical protein